MRKASQNVIDSAQKSIEALNGAIAQQRSMTAGLQNLAATTASQAGQGARAGVQDAIKQATTLDLGPQIKSTVQPTLDSIKTEMSNLNRATAEAEKAARALARHRADWYQKAISFALGLIVGLAFAWIFCLQPLRDIQQTLENNSTVSVPAPAPAPQPVHQGQQKSKPTQAKPILPHPTSEQIPTPEERP
jgi:hypothetical protein